MSEPWMSGVKQRAVDAWMNDNPGDVLTEVIRDARTALAAAQTDAAHWCEKYDGALGKLAAAERERDEARETAKLRENAMALDLSGQALMEARAYLKEHLGVSAAFFDDCIHNAVALCLQARESRDAAVALAEARRVALDDAACSLESCAEFVFDQTSFLVTAQGISADAARTSAALAMTDAEALEALRERVRAEAFEEGALKIEEMAERATNSADEIEPDDFVARRATSAYLKALDHAVIALRALAGGRKPDTEGK